MHTLVDQAKQQGAGDRLHEYKIASFPGPQLPLLNIKLGATNAFVPDYKYLRGSLDSPQLLTLSLPHGTVGDGVIERLIPYLKNDDITFDAGNEKNTNTNVGRQNIPQRHSLRRHGRFRRLQGRPSRPKYVSW